MWLTGCMTGWCLWGEGATPGNGGERRWEKGCSFLFVGCFFFSGFFLVFVPSFFCRYTENACFPFLSSHFLDSWPLSFFILDSILDSHFIPFLPVASFPDRYSFVPESDNGDARLSPPTSTFCFQTVPLSLLRSPIVPTRDSCS